MDRNRDVGDGVGWGGVGKEDVDEDEGEIEEKGEVAELENGEANFSTDLPCLDSGILNKPVSFDSPTPAEEEASRFNTDCSNSLCFPFGPSTEPEAVFSSASSNSAYAIDFLESF